jgi:hypothetical protein
MKALCEIIQVLARGGIDDADALERDIQVFRDFFNFSRVAEDDGCAETQRVELPRGLQNARLIAFWKHDPLGMPLQFFDDVADETHGRKLARRTESAIILTTQIFSGENDKQRKLFFYKWIGLRRKKVEANFCK